jgi:two-component system chemotaxis sensor kinase CheA
MAGAIFLISFGITVFAEGHVTRALADFGVAFLAFVGLILLRTEIPFFWSAFVPITAFTGLCGALMLSGDANGIAGLWIYAQPLIAIFILGMKTGSILSGLLFAAIGVTTFVPGLAGYEYIPEMAFRFCAVYILVVILAEVYEWIRLSKDRWARQLTRELEAERDELAAMKDNLKTGLFFMNRDLIVQGQYSKAIEDIFVTKDLQGKNFTELLSVSLKAKEREILKDYFAMLFEGFLDREMLDDMNPLTDLPYIVRETGEEKTLRCSFAIVNRDEGKAYILGTIQDITSETELQRQLAVEGNERQEEMRTLFEIMQVDQKVFGDFIEDTEYEFDRINKALKKTEASSNDILADIYQSVHAIRSNSVILGLGNFAEQLHELEIEIKNFWENKNVTFEDILHITLELESIMREKDKFQETIGKIRAFNANEETKKHDAVLLETLTQAAEQAAGELGKKIRLKLGQIDPQVLKTGPRRIIKEVLIQLVRNAVYHGIEDPKERRSLGKEATGVISLSMVQEQGNGKNTIHITLRDDGRGLDFERIRKKAETLGLIKDTEKPPDKKKLTNILFMPGFSTAQKESVQAGRGAGLSLVHERIQEARGTISLRSEKGRGMAFDFFIPSIP